MIYTKRKSREGLKTWKLTRNQKRLMVEMYLHGIATRYIAMYFDIGKQAISAYIRRHGLPLRRVRHVQRRGA